MSVDIRAFHLGAVLAAIAFGCALGGSPVASAQTSADNFPKCDGTPGTYPQTVPHLVTSHLSEQQTAIELDSSSDEATLERQILRVTLVPADGPIYSVEPASSNVTFASTVGNGARHTRLRIQLPLPPPGVYRVLVEDRNLSAPAGCFLSDVDLLGTITVSR